MARLPNVTRDKIRPEDLAKFDEMFKSDYFHIRSTTEGVYATLLYSPELADRINALNAYYNLNISTLPLPLREVVILTTMREVNSAYLFIRHCPPAREAGIPKIPYVLLAVAPPRRACRVKRSCWCGSLKS